MGGTFNDKQGNRLVKLARQTIQHELKGHKTAQLITVGDVPDAARRKRGTFVTLHRNGMLRGCIGNLDAEKTVFDGIVDNAINAAFHDSRFQPLSEEELKDTNIEISILTPSEPLEYIDGNDLISKLEPGIDGVTIKKRFKGATFLPQVWQQLQDPAQFLTHLCLKAGLKDQEWMDGSLDVSIYQVQSFED